MKTLESNLGPSVHGAAVAFIMPATLAACATHPAPLPAALDPGADQRPLMQLSAEGVQIYECRAGGADRTAAWTLVAPEAKLSDAQGRAVGQHGAGPTWTAADGSRIVGSVQARADAPAGGVSPRGTLVCASE